MAEKKKDQEKRTSKLTNLIRRPRTPKTDENGAPKGYFRGAWYELTQVRWPDRKATWSLTLAVILFSLFFAGVILGLDYVFQLLFKEVIL